MTEAIDLAAFVPQDTAVLEIATPAGKATGWKVTFAGPSHPQTIAYAEKVSRRHLERSKRIEQQQLNGRKIKAEDRDLEDVRNENVETVVSRIVTWTPVRLGKDGEVIEFTPDAAMTLLKRPDMGWVFTQMTEFLGAEASFFGASAKP